MVGVDSIFLFLFLEVLRLYAQAYEVGVWACRPLIRKQTV